MRLTLLLLLPLGACGVDETTSAPSPAPQFKEAGSLADNLTRIETIAFSPDGNSLACGDVNGTVRIVSLADGAVLREIRAHSEFVRSLDFSPDGQSLASTGMNDRRSQIWDPSDGREIHKLSDPDKKGVKCVAFSRDGSLLATGTHSKVRLWNVADGTEAGILEHPGWVKSIAISADGKWLVSASDDPKAPPKIWDLESRKERNALKGNGVVAFSPDGKHVAATSQQTIRIFEAATGKETAKMSAGNHSGFMVRAVDLRPGLLASAVQKDIVTWSVPDGRKVQSFPVDSIGVKSVAFSPDGKTLAAGGKDGIRILRLIEKSE